MSSTMAATTTINSSLRPKSESRPRVSIQGILLVTLVSCIGLLSVSLSRFAHVTQKTLAQSTFANDKQAALIADAQKRRQRQSCRNMKSVRDIRDCYPPQLVRPLNASCADIDTWEDVQRCLTGRFFPELDTGKEEPFILHIIGERHSGTKFLTRELQQCFLSGNNPAAAAAPPNNEKRYIHKIHRDFIRVKHFFQPLHWGLNHLRSIVVVIVRDPVEWVAAMNEMPYHSPGHVAALRAPVNNNGNNRKMDEDGNNAELNVVPLPWKEFVSRPWMMQRSKSDMEFEKQFENDPTLRTQPVCQESFTYPEVVPCQMDNRSYDIPDGLMRAMTPLYELRRDKSGVPYNHILELRSDKIINFVLQLPLLFSIGGFVVVRYEDLLNQGSRYLLEQISRMVGMKGVLPETCHPVEAQPDRLRKRFIPNGLREWVEANLDVDRERLVGYR